MIFSKVVNVVSVVSNIPVLGKKEKVGGINRKEAERVGINEDKATEF